jgi:hypothetical protein
LIRLYQVWLSHIEQDPWLSGSCCNNWHITHTLGICFRCDKGLGGQNLPPSISGQLKLILGTSHYKDKMPKLDEVKGSDR